MSNLILNRERAVFYRVVQELGRGTYGRCYLVEDLNSGKQVACKEIKDTKEFREESSLHSQLSHKHIIQFYESFERDGIGYIIMEVCSNGNLANLLKCRGSLNNIEVSCVMRQLVDGLQYLHSRMIVHRDIKLLNLLIGDTMDIKIADFGLAKKLRNQWDKRESFCGTNNYVSPEVINGLGHSFPADIWALGCVFFTLLVGEEPFRGSSASETHRKITSVRFPKSIRLNSSAVSFLKTVFIYDPTERPTISSILNHPYFHESVILPKLPENVFYKPYRPKFVEIKTKRTPCIDITNVIARNVCNGMVGHEKENIFPNNNENLFVSGICPNAHGMTLRPRKQNFGRNNNLRKCAESVTKKLDITRKAMLHPQKSKVEQLLTFIKTLLEVELKINQHVDFDNANPSFICVTRWTTTIQPRGFGLAYHLSDGSFSVRFCKESHYHRTQSGKITIFESSSYPVYFTKDSIPNDFIEIVTWAEDIRRHMLELKRTGPNVPYGDIVLVTAWVYYSEENAIAFYLSNGSCQVNFDNHEKILLNLEDDILASWVENNWIVMPLKRIEESGIQPPLHRKIMMLRRFLLEVLEHLS